MTGYALAIDIGGTKIEAALVAPDGTVDASTRVRVPTGPSLDQAGMRRAIREVVSGAATGADVVGVGVGTAGPFEIGGLAIAPVNMPGVHGFALADEVRQAASGVLGREVPVLAGHDGGCLALAESWLGAAKDARSSLSMVVSTGVGAGIVSGGHLLRGASGNAGHLGQTRVDGGLTLEEVAAGPATVRWAQAQGWVGTTGEDLRDAVTAGDELARRAVERSAAAVGEALSNASTLLDLEVVVIGGGFSQVTADYVDLVQRSLTEHAALAYSRATRVVRSGLGGDGPLIGAASLILRA